jgi:hypothetical protein
MRVYAAEADDLIAIRMYDSARALVAGWSKNLANAAGRTGPRALARALPWMIGAFMIGFWTLPPVLLILDQIRLTAALYGWALLTTAASLLFWARMFGRFHVRRYALLFPIGTLFVALLFFRSALLRNRVTWKGRTYGRDRGGSGPG